MTSYPKDVMVFHYDPKRKFYLVTLLLENVPGALGNLANILGIRGINILEGYFGPVTSDTQGTVSFFVESTNPKLDKDWLKEFLQSSVYVSEVQIKESVEGFLADSLNFPLTWNTGDRAVVMRMGNVQVMLDAIRRAGGDRGNDVLYDAGFEYGKATWQNLFGTARPRSREGLAEMLHIYSAVGWGRVELPELDGTHQKACVRMTEGFECTGLKSESASSHFIRGHLAGAMSAYFGTDLKGRETRCISMGDAYCEFSLE